MTIDLMTLFPEMCEKVLNESIIGRARKKNILDIKCHQIRDYTYDKHNRVDDEPYGGGNGMVMMAEPIANCFLNVCRERGKRPRLIYMSPKGVRLTQGVARGLTAYENIAILCGHYEGIDERLIDELVDEQISIGDYVLTGGELPALVLVDTVCRMIKGVLSSDECFMEESHYSGMLEYPQYTRPRLWKNRKVPEVLLSGNHEKINAWRKEQTLIQTQKYRPDLLDNDEKD